MSKSYIPRALHRHVQEEGKRQCDYCLKQERVIGEPMCIEHIIPESRGGETTEHNLCLACRPCNEYKGNKTDAIDPETGGQFPSFNPRTQQWDDHFRWIEDGTVIEGRTGIGRATVAALRLNNGYIIKSRKRWVVYGDHPP